MTTLREAAQQALEALDAGVSVSPKSVLHDRLRATLAQQEDIAQNLQSRLDAALLLEERRQEIAQPHRETEQESTVRIKCTVVDNQHPSGVPFEQWVNAPRREWQGLTEDEIRMAYGKDLKYRDGDYERFARAIEAALKEKNQ